MFCKNCGGQVNPGQTVCPACNTVNAPAENVQSNMALAIVVTVLCCLPFGIVAIVYASKVAGLVAQGNIAAAKDASSKAKTWALVGMGVGFVLQLIWIAFNVLAAVASEM